MYLITFIRFCKKEGKVVYSHITVWQTATPFNLFRVLGRVIRGKEGGKGKHTPVLEPTAQHLSADKQGAFPVQNKPQSKFLHSSVVCSEEEGSQGRLQALEQNSSSCQSGSCAGTWFSLASCAGRLLQGSGIPACQVLLRGLTEAAGNLLPVTAQTPSSRAWKLAG